MKLKEIIEKCDKFGIGYKLVLNGIHNMSDDFKKFENDRTL